ncbi:MAG: Succinyl-diaminopimelate desuccinylase [Gemmatimonadaceae bacterium]|nr:Succinyl-diaminopimelate desuccinylase [Gemmatimonadaceae bacterium]
MPSRVQESIRWGAALKAATSHLQRLIRIDTVNPPGNELGVARYLDRVLRRNGIPTTLLEPVPGRGALVARIAGSGSARPVLLLAHMDVVGVEPDGWTKPPFSGAIEDGCVYGRGAIDDKGMLACNLMAMLLLKRHVVDAGVTLTRDVVFVATGDEETGGALGIDWLATHHRGLLDAEWALNEGGRVRMVGGRPLYAAVQCAEKVPHAVIVRATGTSGHASVPLPDNPIARLAQALVAIASHREPLLLTDISRGFFSALAPVWPDPVEAAAMADISSDDPARIAAGERTLSREPSWDAVIRNGISPTMLAGGIRTNVIPADATATLNVRTLPGESITELIERLRIAVGQPGIEFRLRGSGEDAPASPIDSEMFDAVRDTLQVLSPGLAVVPFLSTGATDSAALRLLGIKAYGLLPFPLTQDDEGRMHGHDERLPLTSLHFGLRAVYGTIRRMTSAV